MDIFYRFRDFIRDRRIFVKLADVRAFARRTFFRSRLQLREKIYELRAFNFRFEFGNFAVCRVDRRSRRDRFGNSGFTFDFGDDVDSRFRRSIRLPRLRIRQTRRITLDSVTLRHQKFAPNRASFSLPSVYRFSFTLFRNRLKLARPRRRVFGRRVDALSAHFGQTKRSIKNERRIFHDKRLRQRDFILNLRRRGFYDKIMINLPTIQGIIKRRILVNYRADKDIIQNILPKKFRPKLFQDKAIVGICLIRLEHIRPHFTPEFVGLSSENAAHRIAVLWENENGETCEGVYIPRRDTDSLLNHLVGGTIFPGEHNKANFEIAESENKIDFAMKSDDGKVFVKLKGEISEGFPVNSIFASIAEASKFFEKGSRGYSVTKSGNHLDGMDLEIKNWKVESLAVNFVESSFYNDETIFPKDSIEFDHALLMQNIAHEWHSAASFELK